MHQHLTLRGGTIPMTDQRVLERVHGFCGCIQCMEGERDRPRGSASFQKVKSKKKNTLLSGVSSHMSQRCFDSVILPMAFELDKAIC